MQESDMKNILESLSESKILYFNGEKTELYNNIERFIEENKEKELEEILSIDNINFFVDNKKLFLEILEEKKYITGFSNIENIINNIENIKKQYLEENYSVEACEEDDDEDSSDDSISSLTRVNIPKEDYYDIIGSSDEESD